MKFPILYPHSMIEKSIDSLPPPGHVSEAGNYQLVLAELPVRQTINPEVSEQT